MCYLAQSYIMLNVIRFYVIVIEYELSDSIEHGCQPTNWSPFNFQRLVGTNN